MAAAAAAVAREKGEGDQTATDTDDELSALSSLGKRNHLSIQELGVSG